MLKLLSEDPSNYKDAPREGIRRLLEDLTGSELPRDQPVATERIAAIRMGTTVSPQPGQQVLHAGMADYKTVQLRHPQAPDAFCLTTRRVSG